MSLRARLLAALLSLALLPTIAFSVFTLDQLNRATDLWYRPGVDQALESLSRDFSRIYSDTGRPSIAPERLLRETGDAPPTDFLHKPFSASALAHTVRLVLDR